MGYLKRMEQSSFKWVILCWAISPSSTLDETKFDAFKRQSDGSKRASLPGFVDSDRILIIKCRICGLLSLVAIIGKLYLLGITSEHFLSEIHWVDHASKHNRSICRINSLNWLLASEASKQSKQAKLDGIVQSLHMYQPSTRSERSNQ